MQGLPFPVFLGTYNIAQMSWHSVNAHGIEGSWGEWTELALLCQQLGSDQEWPK